MPQRQLPRLATLERFQEIRIIGEGSDGPSWLCERQSDKKLVVRKRLDRWVEYNGRPLEVHILRYIVPHHFRILYCDGWAEIQKDNLEVYYEYCKGGDLSSLMLTHERCHESFIWHVFLQIADALAFLHYGYRRDHPNTIPSHWRRVVHRDVKPANIFLVRKYISGGGFPPLVLGDFGLATLDPTTHDGLGTPSWQGPEWPTVTAKMDIWGLGAIIHTLAHGHPPQRPTPREVQAAGEEEEVTWMRSPRSKDPRPLTTEYSQELSDNMMSCLVWQPKDRIDSRSLVKNLVRDRVKWQGRPHQTILTRLLGRVLDAAKAASEL